MAGRSGKRPLPSTFMPGLLEKAHAACVDQVPSLDSASQSLVHLALASAWFLSHGSCLTSPARQACAQPMPPCPLEHACPASGTLASEEVLKEERSRESLAALHINPSHWLHEPTMQLPQGISESDSPSSKSRPIRQHKELHLFSECLSFTALSSSHKSCLPTPMLS